jgi:hypothetical protein
MFTARSGRQEAHKTSRLHLAAVFEIVGMRRNLFLRAAILNELLPVKCLILLAPGPPHDAHLDAATLAAHQT